MIATLTLAAALSLGALAPSGAPADAADQTRPKQAPRALTQDHENTGKKKVIRLDALTVEGRIQKPQAFYILQRSNLNFEELNRTESFIPKVEKSVENDPF